jgi:hypothetical protein
MDQIDLTQTMSSNSLLKTIVQIMSGLDGIRHFTSRTINYAIATGDSAFESIQVTGEKNILTVDMADINSSDCAIELHQSIDGSSWGLVPDSPKTLAIGQPSHTWNIRGLIRGAYIRVAVKKGTATAGSITTIKLLSDV